MPQDTRSADRSASGNLSDERLDEFVRDRDLIVISNRQPYSHDYDDGEITVDCPTGGLTAGLDPVMKQTGGTWIAWGDGDADAEVVDSNNAVAVPPDDQSYRLRRVWLSEDDVDDYYYGYSNQVLWPLCHSALTNMRCEASFWQRYQEVNEKFADAVVESAGDQPLVWFQDYHLALAPQYARPQLPDEATLMHFWHIPWPSWDTYRACPHRRALVKGLLGNDVVAFHVPRYRTNFLECVDSLFDDATVDWGSGKVFHGDHVTKVESVPMGVQFDEIQQSAAEQTADSFWSSFKRAHDIPTDGQIAVGVDRLDYTKGIVERLRALEQLWETHPDQRESLTYVQKASESRSQIPAYQEVQKQVDEEITRINDRFGTDDWQPIVPITERLPPDELYGLYRHADVALVSPVRDGMNLVAQEFMAAQVDNEGVLLLSDQAGVHDLIGDSAITVTPFDTDRFAEAIFEALTMPAAERRFRMRRLRHWAAAHDIDSWLAENLRVAGETLSENRRSLSPA
jgi:trehalose 6-phosphate synthase